MASSTPSTPHRASCRTADFREAVQRQRARLSLPTPASDILPRAKRKSAFTADSLSCLQEVGAMHAVLRESHAAYVLDEALGGMAEAERDGVDAETQRCLKASTAHARTHATHARTHSHPEAERCTLQPHRRKVGGAHMPRLPVTRLIRARARTCQGEQRADRRAQAASRRGGGGGECHGRAERAAAGASWTWP